MRVTTKCFQETKPVFGEYDRGPNGLQLVQGRSTATARLHYKQQYGDSPVRSKIRWYRGLSRTKLKRHVKDVIVMSDLALRRGDLAV